MARLGLFIRGRLSPDLVEMVRFIEEASERGFLTERRVGSVVFRRSTERHLISRVLPGTWSLFIYGPERQWWGYYTPAGKVFWKDYPSCHAAAHPGGATIEERS